jgi:vacuolar-type H+-ATPase subunit H
MSSTNQETHMDTAAERRDRRKKKILENAEQRINAILKGPDGS